VKHRRGTIHRAISSG